MTRNAVRESNTSDRRGHMHMRQVERMRRMRKMRKERQVSTKGKDATREIRIGKKRSGSWERGMSCVRARKEIGC